MKSKRLNSLIEAYMRGNKSAFDEIYELTFREVYLAIYYIVNQKEKAEDILQDTYIRAFQNLEKYCEENNFTGWLVTIGRNLAKNAVTRTRETPVDFTDKENMFGKEEGNEERGIIAFLRDNFDEETFTIVFLSVVSGYSLKEISEKLKIPLSTTAYKKKVGLLKMKEKLIQTRWYQ